MAKITQAPNNPFACASNAVKMHTVGPCCGSMLAVFGYEVQNGGKAVVITPLTGYSSTDLKYYRVSIVDKYGNAEGGAMDLNTPGAAFTVNTSTLDPNGPYIIKFAACKLNGQEEASVSYDTIVTDIIMDPSGTSTPTNYKNVSQLLKLTSTDDANFSLFPVDGVEIQNGELVNLNDYLAIAGLLVNTGSYVFSLEASKCWYSPSSEQPAGDSGDVVASSVAEPSYPILLGVDPVQILNTITIETATLGQFSEDVTTALNSEDVQPSFYFTLKTNVA